MLVQQVLLLHLLDSDWWKSSVSRRYIGKSSSSRKGDGDSGRDGTAVHLLQQHSAAAEEKRRDKPAAAEAPAPFPREAAAGHDDVRRHERQQPGATRGATAATSGHCVRAAARPLLLLISRRRLMRKSYHFMPHSKIIFFICWKHPRSQCILNQECKNAISSQLQTLSLWSSWMGGNI